MDVPEGEITTPPLKPSANQVAKAIRSFKAVTAPGTSGLRAENLKEALSAISVARGAKTITAITALVGVLSAGNFSDEVAEVFCGAKLYTAKKKKEKTKKQGYRPIAVGNVL